MFDSCELWEKVSENRRWNSFIVCPLPSVARGHWSVLCNQSNSESFLNLTVNDAPKFWCIIWRCHPTSYCFWMIQHVDLMFWIGSCRYVVSSENKYIYTSHLKLNVHLCFITRTIKVFCYTLRSSLKLKPRWHMRLKKIPMRLFLKLQTHAPDNTTPRAVSHPPAHPVPLSSPSSADS